MDQLSSSLKKSLTPHGSYKKVSDAHDIENQPILAHRSPEAPSACSSMNSSSLTTRSSIDLNDRREVIVKIDGGEKNNGNEHNMLWHETSYEFWREEMNNGPQNNVPKTLQRGKDMSEDPPSRLIGQFLNKQRAVGCEMTLDMDMEMDELRTHPKPENDHSAAGSSPLINFPPDHTHNHSHTTSRELRVSFQDPSPSSNVVDIEPDQLYNNDSSSDEEDGEISDATPNEQKHQIICSIALFIKFPSLSCCFFPLIFC